MRDHVADIRRHRAAGQLLRVVAAHHEIDRQFDVLRGHVELFDRRLRRGHVAGGPFNIMTFIESLELMLTLYMLDMFAIARGSMYCSFTSLL